MSPSLAIVAFIVFQPALASKAACEVSRVADDKQCLLQTDATVKTRRSSTQELLPEASAPQELTDQVSTLQTDLDEQQRSEESEAASVGSEEETFVDEEEGQGFAQSEASSMLNAEEEVQGFEQTEEHIAAAAATASCTGETVEAFIPRPSVGKGPDIVTFGLMAKTFYGLNVKTNDFVIDMVITLKWHDPRTTLLIPKDATNITLSQAEANKQIWLPEIAVTNRDIKRFDVISTGVMLHEDGNVIKVQRVEVRVKDLYHLSQYPFDSQNLVVEIASSQYMSNAVQLVPSHDKAWSGVNHGLFTGTGFGFVSWGLKAVEDNSGLLKKSRGVYNIECKRAFGPYLQSHLIPCICIMLVACGVFYLPFRTPFVVGRLLHSVVSYLIFVNLKDQSEGVLPGNAPTTWNDVFNTNIMLLMLVAAIINMYSEVRHHVTKVVEVALTINNEMKMYMPVMMLSITLIIMLCGTNHVAMGTVNLSCTIFIAVFLGGIIMMTERRTAEALQEKAAKEAESKD